MQRGFEATLVVVDASRIDKHINLSLGYLGLNFITVVYTKVEHLFYRKQLLQDLRKSGGKCN